MNKPERRIKITLTKRNVSCVATLMDDVAPRTCQIVWDSLPLESQVHHAKYARNEIYTLVPSFGDSPELENTTITPITGDVVYFEFPKAQIATVSHGYANDQSAYRSEKTVDLALFYERNNLLLNPDIGFVPGNVFARIDEGLGEMAAAAQDLWRAGTIGETLRFSRL